MLVRRQVGERLHVTARRPYDVQAVDTRRCAQAQVDAERVRPEATALPDNPVQRPADPVVDDLRSDLGADGEPVRRRASQV